MRKRIMSGEKKLETGVAKVRSDVLGSSSLGEDPLP